MKRMSALRSKIAQLTLRQRAVSAGVLLAAAAILFTLWRTTMTDFNPAKYGSADMDISYCSGSEAQRMDIYYPQAGGPWPALVFIHGGGWMEGDKTGVDASLTSAGFLVASINYRMYPAYRFPAMIEDVKCAVRFLRAHAGQYYLDPQRIILVGHSAGGHLAALGGAADERAGWDVGPYLDISSRVQAVVALSAPLDLSQPYPKEIAGVIQDVFGPDQLLSASPTTYIDAADPPFLIVHGDRDDVVPVEQAHLFHAALAAAGVPAELLIVQNGGHGFEAVGGPTAPGVEGILLAAIQFIARHLALVP
jgi:acetyl esterase/lipase